MIVEMEDERALIQYDDIRFIIDISVRQKYSQERAEKKERRSNLLADIIENIDTLIKGYSPLTTLTLSSSYHSLFQVGIPYVL